jgi:hypothetical protein
MIDTTSIMLVAFGAISLCASFAHYRLSRNNRAIDYNAN